MIGRKKGKKSKSKKSVSKSVEADVIAYNFKTKDYAWLSSFQPCCIEMKDENGVKHLFASAEHAFHFFKTDSTLYRDKIISASGASQARHWGSAKAKCPMRDDWDEVKSEVMYKILLAKYKQSKPLAKRLLATGDSILRELAPWDKELYWGTDKDGKGKNKHGKLTMKVRAKLGAK